MKKMIISMVVGCFILAGGVASASANGYIPPFGGQQKTLQNGVAYLSGGVGTSERAQMTRMDQSYNLRLVFDVGSGAYLSNVAVKIQDMHGKTLVDTVSSGPWFCAKLPAGQYRVTTYFDGQQELRNVDLGRNPRTIIEVWTL